MPKVSTEAGSSTILGAVLLEGGERRGASAGCERGRSAGLEREGGGQADYLVSIMRKKVFITG